MTTIDESIQRSALYGLRHHLSEVGSVMDGMTIMDLLHGEKKLRSTPFTTRGPAVQSFHYGKVKEKRKSSLLMDLMGYECTVNTESLQRIADMVAQAPDGRKRRGSIKGLLQQIPAEAIFWLSIKDEKHCDIEYKSNLQGAVLAAQEGSILAMVGGNSNRDFNRALDAERQLGSIWKTVIYAAAMQLGWTPTDFLDNIHNAFPFEGVWYFPRAAHRAPEAVSMAWAGVRSENIASVWLFYHLTDRLPVVQLKEQAKELGLAQQADEAAQQYYKRVCDKLGVCSSSKWINAVAFHHAKRDWLSDLPESNEALGIRSLLYGHGAAKKIKKLRSKSQKKAAAFNWIALQERHEKCRVVANRLQQFFADKVSLQAEQLLEDEALDLTTALRYPKPSIMTQAWYLPGSKKIICGQKTATAKPLDRAFLEANEVMPTFAVDGIFSLSTLDAFAKRVERKQQYYAATYTSQQDFYSLDFLIHHPDFQFWINFRYIENLLHQLGVKRKLRLSQALPLGAGELTLDEIVGIYYGLLSGTRLENPAVEGRQLHLIERIYYAPPATSQQASEQKLLYQMSPNKQRVSDTTTGWLTADILHNVVQYGTGRKAKNTVKIGQVVVPLLGKTGTTNNFRNGGFCGMIPAADTKDSWSLEKGVTIATYVGFDDNTPMKRGRTRLDGAKASLPIWMQTAAGVARSGVLGVPNKKTRWKPVEPITSRTVDKLGQPSEKGKRLVWVHGASSGNQQPIRRYIPVGTNGVAAEAVLLPTGVGKANFSVEQQDDTGVEMRISDKPQPEQPSQKTEPDAVLQDDIEVPRITPQEKQ